LTFFQRLWRLPRVPVGPARSTPSSRRFEEKGRSLFSPTFFSLFYSLLGCCRCRLDFPPFPAAIRREANGFVHFLTGNPPPPVRAWHSFISDPFSFFSDIILSALFERVSTTGSSPQVFAMVFFSSRSTFPPSFLALRRSSSMVSEIPRLCRCYFSSAKYGPWPSLLLLPSVK